MEKTKMIWDEYCERYYLTGSEIEKRAVLYNMPDLWKVASSHVYNPSSADIQWFMNALEDERCKWFVVTIIIKAPDGFPTQLVKALFSQLIRAAVYERNPSFNGVFVAICIFAFGRRQVSEALFEFVEHGSNFEKKGAVNAFYWGRMYSCLSRFFLFKNRPKPIRKCTRLDSKAVRDTLGDVWLRKRCLFLKEFVSNPNLDVRQSIISQLVIDPSAYPDELKPLVSQAIEIARTHSDDYIRHRIQSKLKRLKN